MELIHEKMIILNAEVSCKEDVLNLIGELMEKNDRLFSKVQYIEDVHEREALTSTAIGDSIAIPHALSSAVKFSSLVFLRLKNKIEWNDGEYVNYIFGIAVPKENKDNEHLKIISMIAKNMLNEKFKRTLFSTESKKEIIQKLTAVSG